MLWTGASPQRCMVVSLCHERNTPCEPHLVIESALAVQELEKLHVSLASPEVEVADFKVAPDCVYKEGTPYVRRQSKVGRFEGRTVTSVVRLPAIVGEEAHCIARGDELGVLCSEFLDGVPERWNRFAVLVERHGEP